MEMLKYVTLIYSLAYSRCCYSIYASHFSFVHFKTLTVRNLALFMWKLLLLAFEQWNIKGRVTHFAEGK